MDAQSDVSGQFSAAPEKRASHVSVIIPVRNDPKRLAKCLAALSTSTLADFEVIVVDDESTDDTAHVAESLGAQVIRLHRNAGAAAARNVAAEQARGQILMFIDADVCVHPDTLAVAVATFDDPTVDAVFGSYDLDPGEPNLLSQYKNLAHRFYHQISNERATTFWTGCGAIRRDVFNAFKFDAEQFKRPSIEDIDLGARMTRAGKKIVINKRLQAKHLKRWTLTGIIKSDLFDRAIPWTRVILREKSLPGDLNLSSMQRIAAVLAALSVAIFCVACLFRPWLTLLPIAIFGAIAIADRFNLRAIAGCAIIASSGLAAWYAPKWSAAMLLPLVCIILINAPFYRFFLTHRGLLFTAAVLPMHVAYYLNGLVGFAVGHLLHYSDLLEQPRIRVRAYVAIAAILYVMGWALVLARAKVDHKSIDFAVSDATGYYGYLPSLVIDHDLQFDNQVAIQYPSKDDDFVLHMKHNRWPIGVALSIVPAFVVAHGLSLPLHSLTGWESFAPHGYSILYFVFCVAMAMGIGTLGMIFADRLLMERYNLDGRTVFAAILTLWLGTNSFWYFVREPLLAHMLGASYVIFAVYLIHRIEREASNGVLLWWRLPLLSFVISMALTCRLTNAYLFPIFVYLLIVLIRQRLIVPALKSLPLVLVAMTPLLLQWIINKNIMGPKASIVTPAGMGYAKHEDFFWTHPALLRSLFSSRHGLFFATPSLLLAAWGLIWHMRRTGIRRDPLLSCFILSAMILWYLNSAWYAWWFGPSVGNRGYVELAPLFVIGFGFAYVWFAQLSRRGQSIVVAGLALSLVVNYGLMVMKMRHLVRDNDSIFKFEDKIFTGRLERI